jgi:hypothetical protein
MPDEYPPPDLNGLGWQPEMLGDHIYDPNDPQFYEEHAVEQLNNQFRVDTYDVGGAPETQMSLGPNLPHPGIPDTKHQDDWSQVNPASSFQLTEDGEICMSPEVWPPWPTHQTLESIPRYFGGPIYLNRQYIEDRRNPNHNAHSISRSSTGSIQTGSGRYTLAVDNTAGAYQRDGLPRQSITRLDLAAQVIHRVKVHYS